MTAKEILKLISEELDKPPGQFNGPLVAGLAGVLKEEIQNPNQEIPGDILEGLSRVAKESILGAFASFLLEYLTGKRSKPSKN